MNKITKYTYLFISLVFIVGCQKEIDNKDQFEDINHGGFDPSERQAIIEIDNPLDGSYINYGEVLNILGNIYSNFNMHGYSVAIYNHENLIWQENNHVHGNHFEIAYQWENNLQNDAALTIKITVVGNHFGTLDFHKELMVFAHGEN